MLLILKIFLNDFMVEITYQDAVNKILGLKQNESSEVLNLSVALMQKSSINEFDYNQALIILDKNTMTNDSKKQGNDSVKRTQEPSAFESLVKDAEKELGTAVSNIGKEVITDIKDISIPSVRKNKLILVYLSTEDQISELEKISLGIDQNVFSKDQLEIINEEVTGLRGYVSSMTRKGFENSGDSQIRNQRLDEVIKKLDNTIK